jgi:hypothetical protein
MPAEPPFDTVAGNQALLGARPQAGADLQNEHLNGMLCPNGLETPAVDLVRGWLNAADLWGHFTQVAVGADESVHGMMHEWRAAGEAIRALLGRYRDLAEVAEEHGQPRCRLNFATLDRLMVAAMEWQELEAADGIAGLDDLEGDT